MKYSVASIFLELESILSDKEKIKLLDKKISELKEEMIENGEEEFVLKPKLGYSDINKIIPTNPRVKHLNELLFFRKSIVMNISSSNEE